MTPNELDSTIRVHRGRWWRESEILILIAFVAGIYFCRAGDLTIRGEESRWATVAREMIRSGDWIVPRQQGELFLSRPPLQNWLIAIVTLARGQCDVWAVRLPTISAVLMTTLLIYAFGRSFLGRVGALTAGLAFSTMGEVMQMGRVAETDLLFTCLLSSAVMVWLWGERRGWPAWIPWTAGYGLAALAALAKGPQAPVYFCGTITIYLAVRRNWRSLFSSAHALGLAAFAVIVGAWQAPFTLAAGWDATAKIWFADSAARFENISALAILRHLATYPLEVLGCTAPWSLFLGAFLSRQFRRSLGGLQLHVLFLTTYFALGFLPCWVSPGGMTRYCLPLYPAVALLAGLVVDRAAETVLSRRLSWAWANTWRFSAVVMLLGAAAVLIVTVAPVPAVAKPWAQSLPVCLAFLAATLPASALVGRINALSGRWRLRQGMLIIAGYFAVVYAGIIVNALVARSENSPQEIARLKERLPTDARLVSFNGIHHLFAYLYDDPIELRPWPVSANDPVTWFCFSSVGDVRPPLPFAWEEVAVISVDRNHHDRPENIVVVGRRIDDMASASRR